VAVFELGVCPGFRHRPQRDGLPVRLPRVHARRPARRTQSGSTSCPTPTWARSRPPTSSRCRHIRSDRTPRRRCSTPCAAPTSGARYSSRSARGPSSWARPAYSTAAVARPTGCTRANCRRASPPRGCSASRSTSRTATCSPAPGPPPA
jgi:hypothetical protein